jgi:hypothetical protein
MNSKVLWKIFAGIFVLTALYHLLAIFIHLNELKKWRNLIFVGIDLLIALGVWKRPAYFVFIFALFLIQQYFSHGNDLIQLWELKHKIDWSSVFTILYLPVVFSFLIADWRQRRVFLRNNKVV